MHDRDIQGLIRASFHAFNSEEEIDQLVTAVEIMS